MKKIAYLRIFDITEIDNINRARYKMMHCEVFEDTDCSGEKLTELFKNYKDDLVLNNITFANMLMCTINIKELNKDNIDDMFHAIYDNCKRLKQFFESINDYNTSRSIDFASVKAVSLGEDIEALILSKNE